ncbi:Putative sensory transduction regulator [Corynebacterium mycetoides]|uniref:Putative sensory transduction regulator n=1 Tax=Corynebacterium mycetoides TaxID=38302 RepID=A0A1G9MKP3_9CORY|nr:YbjN domain-containing protein [Corynebacterium mycetoides]SDL74842.1 Putative sensory transduction regulator [Corynebacterium mycetoides]
MSEQIPNNDDVRPVDTNAVATILREENLEHRVEDDVVRTGFIDAAMVFAIDDGTLVFEAVWRGEFPKETASQVLYACNEHNQSTFTPTLRFFESDDETLAVSAVRTVDITHGASFNQLGAFVVSSIDATLQAFRFLADSFPTLVTWEDTHYEH